MRPLMLPLTGMILISIVACKHEKNDVFPAIDFIKSQVAAVDSSVDPILELRRVTDSTYDTVYLKREDFNQLAREFTETPDISKKFGGKYTETRMMNNELGQVVFTSTPSDENLEVRRQEVRIVPDPPHDRVKSIYLERFRSNGDSSVTRRLTWHTDKSFQIVTIVQKKNGEEKDLVVDVVWNTQSN